MAPQRLEKIEFAPGNGMASEASNPQDMARSIADAICRFQNRDIFFLKSAILVTVHHRPLLPGSPHAQDLQEVPPRRAGRARHRAGPWHRDATRDRGPGIVHSRVQGRRPSDNHIRQTFISSRPMLRAGFDRLR